MHFCPNCGEELNDDELFCRNCGKEQHPEVKPEPEVSEQINESMGAEQKTEESVKPEKPKRKIKIPVIIALVAVVAAIGVTAYYFWMRYYIRSNPVRWTDYCLEKTLKADTIETTGTTKLFISSTGTRPEEAQMLDIANNISIKTSSKADRNKKEAYYTMSVLYKGQNIIDAKAYMDSTGIIIYIPALYEKSFYVNYDELNKLNSQNKANKNSDVDFNAYKVLLDVSGDKNFSAMKKDYINFLGDKLKVNFTKTGTNNVEVTKSNGQNSSIKCDELDFTINNDQVMNIVKALMQKAADDKNVKAFSKSKLEQFLSIVDKRNDYEKFNMNKAEAKDYIKNFDSNYDKAMEKIKEDIKEDNSQLNTQATQSMKFNSAMFIGSDNYIRGYNLNLNCSYFYIQSNNTVNSINERITIDKLDKSNAVDIAKMDDASEQQIYNSMMMNIYKIIQNKLGVNIFNGIDSD